MEHITITSMHYHMRYHTFSPRLALFGSYLQRVTVKFIKKMYITIFLKKLTVMRGNSLPVAPKSC